MIHSRIFGTSEETICCFCKLNLPPYSPKTKKCFKRICRHTVNFINKKQIQLLFNGQTKLSLGFNSSFKHNTYCVVSYMFEEIGIRVKERFTRLSLQRKFCGEIGLSKNLFVPKIDGHLLSRFLQMFETLEHYSIAFSSAEALKLVQLKPLFISKDMTVCHTRYFLPNFENSNILITNTFNISDTRFSNDFDERIFTSIALKTLIIKAKVIKLHWTEMCHSSFFLLLSPKIVELRVDCVKITPNPIASNIISQIPNLETLRLIDASIKYDKNWIIVLLNNCKALKYACVEFKSLYLAPECLPVVFKKDKKNYGKEETIFDANRINYIDAEIRKILSGFKIKILPIPYHVTPYFIIADKQIEST